MGEPRRAWQTIATVARVLLALAIVAGCDGRVIRLGERGSSGDGGIVPAAVDSADARGTVDIAMECIRGQVKPSEVIWIGDSWVLLPTSTRSHLRELAYQAGSLGPNEDYVSLAAPAKIMAEIADQYASREAGGTKVKVVLMDGGTWDTIKGNGSDASVTAASSSFQQFLTTVASHGTVQHIIYFLPPELATIPGVAALRPLVQQACNPDGVPSCHFLDLQRIWTNPSAYTVPASPSSPIEFPTDLGGQVIAEAIWQIMQQNCIAQ
jgi:hypothetical protein